MNPHSDFGLVLPGALAAQTLTPRALAPGAQPQGTALTYGTFDLFHVGHLNLFRRIKERYARLIVAVSTDEFNAIKGKRSTMSFADRFAMVAACRHVDVAIPEHDWAQKERDIVEQAADAFVMGSDWAGHFDALAALCDVVYLPRTEGISSTALKQDIAAAATAVALRA